MNSFKLARLYRGLSAKAVSEATGIPAVRMTRIEQGTSQPRSEEHFRLLKLYGPSGSHIDKAFPAQDMDIPAFFRKKSTVRKRQKDSVLVKFQYIERLIAGVALDVDFHPYTVPDIGVSDLGQLCNQNIRAIALSVRDSVAARDQPIKCVHRTLEDMGVFTASIHTYEPIDIDGVTSYSDRLERGLVLYNRSTPLSRVQFSLAHELGHLVLHRHLPYAAYEDEYSRMEKQAHLFASYFLLPDELLNQRFKYFEGLQLIDLIEAKIALFTSAQAILYALKSRALITEFQSVNLNKQISYKGYRRVEPSEAHFYPYKTTVLRAAVHALARNEGVETTSLLRRFGVPVDLDL